MPMLVRCRGVLSVLQRAVVVSNQSNASIRWLQTGTTSSTSSARTISLASKLATANPSYSVSNRFYSAAATPNVAEVEDRVQNESRRRNPPRGRSDSLDKILHGISLNVQRTGRVLATDLKQAEHMVQVEGGCTANQALLLLRCCGAVCVDERFEDRTRMATRMWDLLERTGVQLDESHYNALLRCHIENEHEFSPSEFLSWMENQHGVMPNRVTYQHLVARYCALGDIAGATTILEFMKQKDMTVNENVFHSLITGHCRNGDFDAAESIMTIMADSGIDVGSEAYISLLLGMARAGKSLEEIEAKMETATKANVQFGDHEIFRLVVELTRHGNKEAAAKFAQAFPRSRGFFQELRNAVPQMIFAGELDLSFSILASFKPPNLADQTHADASSRDHGLFFLRAMVKNEYPMEKVMEFLDKLNITAENSGIVYITRLLEICIEYNKKEYGRTLAEAARAKYGNDIVKPEYVTGFLRSHCKHLRTKEDAVSLIQTLTAIGIPIPNINMANDLMPKLLGDDPMCEPAKVAASVIDQMDLESRRQMWPFMINCAIQHLLNREDKEGFFAVARMAANITIQPRPTMWTASLARSFLATGEQSYLITTLYSCSAQVQAITRGREIDFDKDVELFSTLLHVHALAPRYRPDKTADEILLSILNEMKRIHLGLPEATVEALKRVMTESSAASLLDELFALHKDRTIHLTKARVDNYYNSVRASLAYTKSSGSSSSDRSGGYIPILGSGYVPESDFPTDLEGLEKLKKIMDQREFTNFRLYKGLAEEYAKLGNLDKVESLLGEIQQGGDDQKKFSLSPHSFDAIVDCYGREKKFDEGLDLLMGTGSSSKSVIRQYVPEKIYMSTIVNFGSALAEAGRHEDVIKLYQSLDESRYLAGNAVNNITGTMDYYADVAKDPARVQAVYDILKEKKLISRGIHASPLIDVRLNIDDIEGAVQAFENVAKEDKVLPAKFSLMDKLIQLEDMEKMQRVLDASISVIGEERSLYDLALNFLYLGKTSQARKLLETPGLRYNPEKVNFICNFFIDKGMTTALENFVHLTQPVFACDREFLYTKLIDVYKNDSSKMGEVWVKMQEEGFIPSDALKLKMAVPFVKEGKDTPFQVPKEVREAEVTKQSATFTATKVKKESTPAPAKATTARTQTRSEKKEKEPKEKKEKSAETLAHEQMIDEKLSGFVKAVEANDVATAAEEFNNFLKLNLYLPAKFLSKSLYIIVQNEAWSEGVSVLQSVLARGNLENQLNKHSNQVRKILANAKPEELKAINDSMKNEATRKKFNIDSLVTSATTTTSTSSTPTTN